VSFGYSNIGETAKTETEISKGTKLKMEKVLLK
jgi:hypothetical protein